MSHCGVDMTQRGALVASNESHLVTWGEVNLCVWAQVKLEALAWSRAILHWAQKVGENSTQSDVLHARNLAHCAVC